ncbi:MAG: MBL fold metallo-hydrolase RNA specificity domain-containing protein [Candidatus Nanohaloarchaea archaeon]
MSSADQSLPVVIRQKDGIEVDAGERVLLDSRNARGDVNFVSHAHFDHMHQQEDSEIVCSDLTAALCKARSGKEFDHVTGTESIELLPSGHILGSSAALIQGDETVLYTGDVATRDRAYIEGFEPVDADTLIVETTYGIPAYTFPEQESIESRIKRWIEDNSDRPLYLFAYSLGKAQKVQHLIQDVTDRPLVAHGSVTNMNDVVSGSTELEFDAVPYTENRELLRNGEGIFIGPTRFARDDSLNELVDETGGLKAGFSGWAVSDSYQYRGGYDEAFPLSDHCDFEDLVALVREVDPEKVYTTHGYDEAFAAYLKREHGYDARALKKNQTSLSDF